MYISSQWKIKFFSTKLLSCICKNMYKQLCQTIMILSHFFVFIEQLLDRNSNIHKKSKESFHDWANFINFCEI